MQSNSGRHPTPSTCQKLPHTTVNIPMKFDERNQNILKIPPFLFPWQLRIPIFFAYINPLDVDVTGNITAKICEVGSEFNIFCTLVTMATATIFFYFFNPKSCHTLRWIFLQSFRKFWWKESKICLNLPFFCFHGNCGKVCPTDSDLFVLSRSTRCGCCSYQVSSISVWRITRYDHFCVFQFFSILAVCMATAAILKKSTLKSTTSHGIWYSYKVS